MLKLGQLLVEGNYKVGVKLGEGAFGEVWRAERLATKQVVAIKREARGRGEMSLLRREFNVYQWLVKGANPLFYPFPAVHQFYQNAEASYLVMDCCGLSLMAIVTQEKLEADGYGGVPDYLDYGRWCQFARHMIRMLEVVHRAGIIHRDIKPANFVLRNADCFIDEAENFVLLDFGLAELYTDEPLQVLSNLPEKPIHSLVGSVNYASVNSHRRKELSRRDDLESLAYVLLYVWMMDDLPWAHFQKEEDVLRAKMALVQQGDGVPQSLIEFLRYVRLLELHEAPSYRRMERYFQYEPEMYPVVEV